MSIEFKHATLSNGLHIIAEVDQAAHSAAMGFFVKTGARDEAAEVMGVSHFLEHMMFKGTQRRTAEQVDRDFDDIGAEHNAFTTSELTAFHAHTLPEHLPRASEVLSDILRPALRNEDFDGEKKVILEEIAMYDDNPFWVLYERAMEVYYGSHPLGHRVLGTPQTISELNRDQMMAYFTNRYSADNTVVAMAGRLDFDAMVRLIQRECGGWNISRTSRVYPVVTPAANTFTIRSASVHRHYMLLLSPAPAQEDDRRYAAAMLSQVLGDADGSRLYWALVETGIAEEAQSQYDGRDGCGEFLVYAACDPDAAAEVERITRQQIAALIDSITEDDLERVRSKIATGATLHGELPAGRMRRLGRVWTYSGMYRSLEADLARINAVTLADLRAVHDAFDMQPRVCAHLMPE